MSDIAKTLIELLAVAELQIRKMSMPGGQPKFRTTAAKIGGGSPLEHSGVIESGDEETALRKVLLGLLQKLEDWKPPRDYPR